MFKAIILTAAIIGTIIAVYKHDHRYEIEFHDYFFTAYVGGSIGGMIGLLIACIFTDIPQ